jgi:hypothetical protein
MKIQLAKSRWNGAEYITATRHPHCEDNTVDRSTWDSIVEWCEQRFGPIGDPWAASTAARWYFNGGSFFFKQQPDLTMFLLRWSCE